MTNVLLATRVLSAIGKVASSTIFSCVVACQIETGANRIIYSYFPYKFANVESASGITQEELYLAKMNYGVATSTSSATTQQEEDNHNHIHQDQSFLTEIKESEFFFRYHQEQDTEKERSSHFDILLQNLSSSLSTTIQTTKNKNTIQEDSKNWMEQEKENKAAEILSRIMEPSQEIITCSMTA